MSGTWKALVIALGLGVMACSPGRAAETTLAPAPTVSLEMLDFTVLREWTIPAGGFGAEILVKQDATERDVLALGNWFLDSVPKENPKSFLNIRMYDARNAWQASMDCDEAYATWSGTSGEPSICTRANELAAEHLLAGVTRNPKTGYREVAWMGPDN